MKEKILQLQKEINSLLKEMESKFRETLKEYLKSNSIINSVRININNHEFNDGDATYFGLYYDDLVVEYGDEGEFSGYEKNVSKEIKEAREGLVKLFEDFDVLDFYENIFGGYSESIRIKIENGKLEIE